MKKTVLRRYARLIARVGAAIRPGQTVVIRAETDQPEFVTMVAEECYRAGAEKVTVEFTCQTLERLDVQYCSLRTLSVPEPWERAQMRCRARLLPCRIYLLSEDPDGMTDVDREKLARGRQNRAKLFKPFRDQMEGKYQWCIAAVPGRAWAKKVFPGLSPAAAEEALWNAILTTARVTEDPVAAWDAHNRELQRRCDRLNALRLRSLHYTAGNGTELTVGMIPQARFCGGQETTAAGNSFNPNIPTEECFISPKRGEAEGIVYASKPLSWQGQLIEGFWFRFHEGRVTDCGAARNGELLKKLVAMDEGAAYLGECALVPYESPVNRTGLLFYNTLFDENACCHLALGMGFIDTIEGYHEKTLREMRDMGVNDSIIHEDFMIGTEDLAIDGETEDGRLVPIFRNGTWVTEK